jgi:hypothetical protein
MTSLRGSIDAVASFSANILRHTANIWGRLSVSLPIVGSFATVSSLVGTPTIKRKVAGAFAGVSTLSSGFIRFTSDLAGAIDLVSSMWGKLHVKKAFVGTIDAAGLEVGVVSVKKTVEGAISVLSSLSATAQVAGELYWVSFDGIVIFIEN